jgi:hypothetical protein
MKIQVMGHARERKFQQEDMPRRHLGDQIRDEEGEWFVGDLTLAQLPPGGLLRLRGRTANESTVSRMKRRIGLPFQTYPTDEIMQFNRQRVTMSTRRLPYDNNCDYQTAGRSIELRA